MNIDTSAGVTRPRPWLLIALGLAIVVFVANYMWPRNESAAVAAPASNQARGPRPRGADTIKPDDLDVRIEALDAPRPGPGESERNPFRFQPKAPPPPPPDARRLDAAPAPTVVPTGPPPPPPIPLRFIGIVEKEGLKVAALSDCKGNTFYEEEGKTVDGRYRLIKIGIESVVMEYVNGTGRTTIRLEGCPAR